jgi:subtilisin family serine protease
MRLIAVTLVIIASCFLVSNCVTTNTQHKTPFMPIPHQPGKPQVCNKKPIIVAVIDTGFGVDTMRLNVKLCKFGHKDFTDGATSLEYNTKDGVPVDSHGHGTHIAGIIDAFGKKANINYCLVILKYYVPNAYDATNLANTIKAINYAKNIHADYINYSGGGPMKSDEEVTAVKEFLDQGGKFLAAAGNEGSNLDWRHFYPAQDDPRVTIVGAVDDKGERIPMSNFGKDVKRTELGKNVKVCDESMCMTMSGTSQATAIATGKMLAQEKNTCN